MNSPARSTSRVSPGTAPPGHSSQPKGELVRRNLEPGPVERRQLDRERVGPSPLERVVVDPSALVGRVLGPGPLVARPLERRRWERARGPATAGADANAAERSQGCRSQDEMVYDDGDVT